MARRNETNIDRREAKKRARRKKMIRRRRRYLACLLLIILMLVVLLFSCGKKDKKGSVSGNNVSENKLSESENAAQLYKEWAAGMNSGTSGNQTMDGTLPEGLSSNAYQPLDVTKGVAVFHADTVSGGNIGLSKAAKEAMAGQAYFTGTNRTVNEILNRYGAGEWHCIISKQNAICVFYEGKHNDKESFKVNFVLYEDGSFVLDSVTVDGEQLDDYTGFITSLVS